MMNIQLGLGVLCVSFSVMISACSSSYATVSIEGASMLPTFRVGDHVLIRTGFSEIKRGDVVLFKQPGGSGRLDFKRVIGLPKEVIRIQKGKVFVNSQVLFEPYLDQSYNELGSNLSRIVVPNERYFVLGDNRDNSSDSRSWGTLEKDEIIGKFCLTYWKSR